MPIALNLQQSLLEAAKKGYFSHAYIEAGWLQQQQAHISYAYPRSAESAVFDLASLSKALVTAPLVIKHFTNDLSQPWGHYAKAMLTDDRPWWTELSLASLLSHDSGLPAWRNFWINRLGPESKRYLPWKERGDLILATLRRSLSDPPSRIENRYSDLGYLILGLLLEQHRQQPLHALFDEFLTETCPSLAACDLAFAHATDAWQTHYVPSTYCPIRARLLVGEVHDENAAALGGVCGHAGLFSSGPKLGLYLRKLFQSGTGRQLLALAEQRLQQGQYPYGLRLGDDEAAQGFARKSALLGHWGFTGTAFWFDPSDGRYAIILSNRVLHHRLLPEFKGVRRTLLEALAEALGRHRAT